MSTDSDFSATRIKKKKDPEINFTLHVAATDDPLDAEQSKIKVAMDFNKEFTPKLQPDRHNFNVKRIREILHFVSDVVIRKIVEHLYFDRYNNYDRGCEPRGFYEALEIYNERLKLKESNAPDYLDHREEEIKKIVENFIETLETEGKERDVTRFIFENLSPPALSYDTRSMVNSDKRPK